MKLLLNISRIIVGVLFIFSGLIKANDPLGLSYKMQEFFEVWGWHSLNDYTLAMSIIMNVFEVMAGIALLIGWNMRLISRLLLLLIVFFTFLTGYALRSGKIKTCGCFGDCLPLTPLQSFLKDVLLLLLIVLILVNHSKVKPLLGTLPSFVVLLGSIIAISYMQAYALTHLPFVDCLPYKKGNNLIEKMKVPPGAVPDSFAMTFRYKKNGNVLEFDPEHFPADFDSTYEFVDRYDKLVRKGNATAPITDFALQSLSKTDTTTEILSQPGYYVLFYIKDFSEVSEWKNETFSKIQAAAKTKNIPLYYVTSLPQKALEVFGAGVAPHVLICDATVIKTAVRVNPSYVLMRQANVLQKYSYADADTFLEKLEAVK
ncbi:BT_3928 family protein [Foetidibacter luteolus]|uniref:BT_3928 family protein n=1 Tax=Foetidibacter luteolus TaxID=2608880 RepID=UPI00129A4068|nr:BT_3928 family protein [Foetidibacter luteolus]